MGPGITGWDAVIGAFQLSRLAFALEAVGEGILIGLEALILLTLAITYIVGALFGLLLRFTNSCTPRGVYPSFRFLGVSLWIGLIYLVIRMLTGSSAIGVGLSFGADTLESLFSGSSGSGPNMLVAVITRSAYGLWLGLGAFLILSPAYFSRRMD